MSLSGYFHKKVVYSRRMDRLSKLMADRLKSLEHDLKKRISVLDLGCGDGKIDSLIMKRLPFVQIEGIDVLVRDETYINVSKYDGKHIPFADGSYDAVMVVDVLHHTDRPEKVFEEICRVSNKYILIKDHIRTGSVSYIKLRAMDHVGNAHYHVRSPYNYLTDEQWKHMYSQNKLKLIKIDTDLHLYKGIFHLLFDRNLHFIAILEKEMIY